MIHSPALSEDSSSSTLHLLQLSLQESNHLKVNAWAVLPRQQFFDR